MRARILFLTLAGAACAFGQYSYDFNGMPYGGGTCCTSTWTLNGTAPSYVSGADQFGSDGSLIYTPTVSGANSNDYEVNTALSIITNRDTLIHYVRASSTALASSGSCAGSYISAEVAVLTTTVTGYSPVAAQLTINQCTSGSLSTLGSTTITIRNGSDLRTVVFGTSLWVFVDDRQVLTKTIPATTGQPGVGGYGIAVNGFGTTRIGHHDTVAPNLVNATGLRSSVFPTSVSLEW